MKFPGGSDGKESSCNAGDMGLIPGSEYITYNNFYILFTYLLLLALLCGMWDPSSLTRD